jgi:hypothetical protein
VPYYRVDHVAYRTNAPWPQTVPGTSLERVPIEAYGNDAADWRATPSGATPGVPAANRPPIITVTGHTVVPQLTPLTLTLAVADLDVPWQRVSLTSAQLPAGSTFDQALGTFSWTPAQAGDFIARFTATDTTVCGTNQTSLEFVVQVTQPLAVTAQYFAGGLQLSFPALPGETYHLEYCTDLSLADWRLLEEIVATQSTVVTVADVESSQSSARFYRIRWLR